MNDHDIASMLTGGFLVYAGGLGFWVVTQFRASKLCFCGHPPGCGNAFGECTRKIRVRNYTGGRRAGWKYDPCKCRDHAQPKAVTS